MSILRPWVVMTRDFPVLGPGYRGVYEFVLRRVRSRLASPPSGVTVFLRGSARRGVDPGLSDIDLVVILPTTDRIEEEIPLVSWARQRIAEVHRPVPLVRDVHFFAEDELGILAALHHPLLALLRGASERIGGHARLPEMSSSREMLRTSGSRQVTYWLVRAFEHVMEGASSVDRLLAARALGRATATSALLGEHGYLDETMVQSALGQRAPRALPITFQDLASALGRFDALPDAPPWPIELAERDPRLERCATEAERWLDPLLRTDGIESAVVSVGSPLPRLSLHIALDPAHPRLDVAIAAIAERARISRWCSGPEPAERPRIVTRRALARSVLLPDFGALPSVLARGRTFGAPLPGPRASGFEVAYAEAEALMKVLARERGRVRLADYAEVVGRLRAQVRSAWPALLAP